MLDAAGALLNLWADAILAANYILVRLSTSAVSRSTTFKAWNRHKPTIGHIRKWGCKVYHHINKETSRKNLCKKSMVGFLVGYQRGDFYRIYPPVTKEFKVSRDVIIDET
jgi:hypothetical protein